MVERLGNSYVIALLVQGEGDTVLLCLRKGGSEHVREYRKDEE